MISLLSTYRFIYVLIIGIGVTAYIGWYLASEQANDAIEVTKPSPWTMPDWKPHPLTQDVQILRDKQFFGSKKIEQVEPEPEQEPVKVSQDWRVIGIISDSDQSKILIKKAQTNEVQSLKVGDKLPDERILEKILRDSFIVASDQAKEEIRLYPFEPTEVNNTDEPVIEDKNDD